MTKYAELKAKAKALDAEIAALCAQEDTPYVKEGEKPKPIAEVYGLSDIWYGKKHDGEVIRSIIRHDPKYIDRCINGDEMILDAEAFKWFNSFMNNVGKADKYGSTEDMSAPVFEVEDVSEAIKRTQAALARGRQYESMLGELLGVLDAQEDCTADEADGYAENVHVCVANARALLNRHKYIRG